jgi:hypothetical protein
MLTLSFPSHPPAKIRKRLADPRRSELIKTGSIPYFGLALIFTTFPSQSSTDSYISHQEQESVFDDNFFGEILLFWGLFTHLLQTSSWIFRFRHVEDDTNHC